MKEKKYIHISIVLMLLSGVFLFFAVVYYELSAQVKNYNYSDNEEYQNITEGLSFLNTLPIHFNIINKYFSNINNLDQNEKEEIIMSWVIKNQYKLYECGPSNNIEKYLCISKKDLNGKELQKRFNMDLTFTSNNIKIYADDYGTYAVTTTDNSDYYKIVLYNTNNKNYRLYSKFSHYKQDKDKYIFYLYQGYYKGNCTPNEKLNLYDFMTGKIVYSDECNGNQNFKIDPSEKIKKLQLYKYELKRDENNNFYLKGYNPVNNIES